MVRVAKSKNLVTASPTQSNSPSGKASQSAGAKKRARAAKQSPKPALVKSPAETAADEATARVTRSMAKAVEEASPPVTRAKSKSGPRTKTEKKMAESSGRPKRQLVTPSSPETSNSKALSPEGRSQGKAKVAVKSAGLRFDLESELESEAESDSDSDWESLKSLQKSPKSLQKSPKSPQKSPKSPQKSPKSPQKSPNKKRSESPRTTRVTRATQAAQASPPRHGRAPASAKRVPYSRRAMVPYTAEEVAWLHMGVSRYGVGSWAEIRKDPEFKFYSERSAVDLKDKWRNIGGYRKYSERQMRKYMMVNAKHEPLLSRTGRCQVYSNRWPRDAAMKVSSRSDHYPSPDATGPITIYLREIRVGNEDDAQHVDPVVHVYSGRRHRVPPAEIDKFKGLQFIWKAEVKKLRTEMLSYGSDAFTETISGH